ncbi:nucleotide-binding protein [Paraburkholderia fungorum]|uniref:Nucleotide-binding protein n=1 Tax=Paraburkholderia fungorum TaxID=134537 RepID=A0AAP5UVQ3_9BURK|nr:nucleotide-binding protein [Paraburkholderia fungorum]MDT8840101.1 nucleotide-binding protein [Paraburkholderia fungorum]
MYNLLMSAGADFWEAGKATAGHGRYLEFTHEAIRARFEKMTDAVIEELKRMPTLFAYEKDRYSTAPARVGWITDIRRLQNDYELTYQFDPAIPPIDPGTFESLWPALDIDPKGWEGTRTHWAIKEVDLIAALQTFGLVSRTIHVAPPLPVPAQAVTGTGQRSKVFVVHGRADGVKQDVARFLERIGIEPVILHERPNGGRTLITKFQEESADVAYAVVLMTPDDVGGLNDGLVTNRTQPRARQNVIFELGFFIGRLGASRVCALVQGKVEKPSDFDAVVYVAYDGTEAWQLQLARELAHAGVPHDVSRLVAR